MSKPVVEDSLIGIIKSLGDRVRAVERFSNEEKESGAIVGEMKMWSGVTAPAGWQLCDGSVAATAELKAHLVAQGRPFGGAAGSELVPDLRGRMPVGRGTDPSVDALGENEGKAVAQRWPHTQYTVPAHTHSIPNHTHSIPAHNHTLPTTNRTNSTNLTGTADAGNTGTSGPWTSGGWSGTTGSGGGGLTDWQTPAFLVVNFIIKT